MPIDEVSVTGSPSGSKYVPVMVAVSPATTSTDVSSELTCGASLPFAATTSNSEIIPNDAWKKMWQWKTQRPSPPPSVVPSIRKRSSSRTRKRSV